MRKSSAVSPSDSRSSACAMLGVVPLRAPAVASPALAAASVPRSQPVALPPAPHSALPPLHAADADADDAAAAVVVPVVPVAAAMLLVHVRVDRCILPVLPPVPHHVARHVL